MKEPANSSPVYPSAHYKALTSYFFPPDSFSALTHHAVIHLASRPMCMYSSCVGWDQVHWVQDGMYVCVCVYAYVCDVPHCVLAVALTGGCYCACGGEVEINLPFPIPL